MEQVELNRRRLVRLALPQDESALLALFSRAFGHDMPQALWRWKYAGQPSAGMLAEHEGQPVAFYGGMPRDIRYFGHAERAVQIGDVMVAPDERGMLRSGAFFQVASTFLEQTIGYDKPFLLGFGFPTRKALKLAERLGLYATVGAVEELSWHASPGRPSFRLRSRLLGPDATAGMQGKVNALWQAMAGSLQAFIVGVRDWAWLVQRYLAHPTIHYEVRLIEHRWTGKPLAVVILRFVDNGVELMDVIGNPAEFPAAIGWIRRYAGRRGLSQVKFWITTGCSAYFAGTHATSTALDLRIPCNVWSPGPAPESINGRWWLTAGDTDFR